MKITVFYQVRFELPPEANMKITVLYQIRFEVATRNEYGDYCFVSSEV
jgi:hypothetical protein